MLRFGFSPSPPPAGSVSREEASRIEVDTFAPFESVKEGGMITFDVLIRAYLFLILKNGMAEEGVEEMSNIKEQAEELEKDLIIKERETLDVFKEFEAMKVIVEELKLKPQIQTSELLNKKLEKERALLERTREMLTNNSSKMSCLEQELGKTGLRLTANYSKLSLYQQPVVEDSDEELDYVANNSGAVNSVDKTQFLLPNMINMLSTTELMAIPVTFCAGMPSPRLL
ncbi:WEB family protein At2g38370 [Linum perenne]